MRVPDSVTIGHLDFTIRIDDPAIRDYNSKHSTSVVGYTNHTAQEIVLATEDNEGTPLGEGQLRTTLLHEILHAAIDVSSLERKHDEEERWVSAIQGPLLIALQNPELRDALTAPRPVNLERKHDEEEAMKHTSHWHTSIPPESAWGVIGHTDESGIDLHPRRDEGCNSCAAMQEGGTWVQLSHGGGVAWRDRSGAVRGFPDSEFELDRKVWEPAKPVKVVPA